jgi:hypothetical protein
MEGITSRVSTDMSERDVETAFLQEGFYSQLGYEGVGYDLRSEWALPDERRPDYATLNDNQAVTTVFEFKNPTEDLSDHVNQLFGYTEELKANYGVLTNGQELRLFERDNGSHKRVLSLSFETVSEDAAKTLSELLRKPRWETTDATVVNDYLADLEQVKLERELGREEFFETFRLEEGSPFANLVTAGMNLLKELRDEREEDFVAGAYNYWEQAYASEPKEIPESWEEYLENGKDDLKNFMFCLETAHALLSRLLLAKAVDDNDFFPDYMNRGIGRYFDELGGFDGQIDSDAYPVAANGLIQDMREDLVESLFEDDIFVWWKDGYKEQLGRGHESPENQFKDVAKGNQEGIEDVVDESVEQLREVRQNFSEAVAEVLFAVLKFDFTAIRGDPLGNLYQRYFDPETRKALGEFYTPQPVIEYIMDGVEYDRGVSNERIIDPSCGSGTFLVEAVERYLQDVERYHDEPDWERHLSELCIRPHIVGLDIHPFAVLMAQIRFTVAILPKYKIAKNQNPDFTIRRLPIFRTDSLQNERESAAPLIDGTDHRQATLDAISETEDNIEIPVPLPLEADDAAEGEFHNEEVRLPLYGTLSEETDVSNYGEYFGVLQAMLDVVKDHMNAQMWEYQNGISTAVSRYISRDIEGIESFTKSYINSMLKTVEYLRKEKGDGRLFKIFEDGVLSLVVKNYLNYEYVVGNPPYVRIQNLPEHQKASFDELYDSATGNYDLYCLFYERGLDWLTEDTGRLGYIAPNQFMVTDYGEGIRQVMLNEAQIKEVYDFRDSGVFEDATNYPAIVIMEDEDDSTARSENQIRCVRVKANVDDESGRELDEAIISGVQEYRDNPGYSDEFIDVFDIPQGELHSETYWALMPPAELEIFRKLESKADTTIGEITDAVFQGIRTSKNKVYVVEVLDADRVESEDTEGTVTVVPTGGEREFEIETDLLRPFLKGKDVERWRGDWSGLHVIYPYHVEVDDTGENTARLYTRDELRDLPLTWDYLKEHENELRGRERGRWEGSDSWWEFGRTQNLEKFEQRKIIQAHICQKATFMLDETGTWYFTTAYGVLLTPDNRVLTEEIAGQLNSKVLDFYFKHITSVKAGGYYEYRSQYVEKLPCIVEGANEFQRIQNHEKEITSFIDLESRTNRFPEAYLGDFSGELEYIDYEWQTRRYPVDANIQALADGGFAVEAGRSDRITDPRMESESRARYVLTAVDGRNVRKGEETSIPIPRQEEDVETLLNAVEEDKQHVRDADISQLEESINEAVYDLFGLTEDEISVIENYLSEF